MTTAGKNTKGRRIERGSVGDEYLRREYDAFRCSAVERSERGERSEEPQSSLPAELARLARACFDYLVRRLIDQYVASGSGGLGGLKETTDRLARTAFEILLAADREQVKAVEAIGTTLVIGFAHERDRAGAGASLGAKGRCEMGRTMIVGETSAEEVPRLDCTIGISAAQLRALRSHPDALEALLDAFDRLVPLHMDYQLYFSVSPQDRAFRLGASGAEGAPLLGITTALGAL
jgi:hypothetical protein